MDFNKRRVAATEPVARLQSFGFFRFNRYKNDTQKQQYTPQTHTHARTHPYMQRVPYTRAVTAAAAAVTVIATREQSGCSNRSTDSFKWMEKLYVQFRPTTIRCVCVCVIKIETHLAYFRRTEFLRWIHVLMTSLWRPTESTSESEQNVCFSVHENQKKMRINDFKLFSLDLWRAFCSGRLDRLGCNSNRFTSQRSAAPVQSRKTATTIKRQRAIQSQKSS